MIERKKAKKKADSMDEEDRIDLIREEGTQEMEDGMKSIFGSNKYKPQKNDMWNNKSQLNKGKKMVMTIIMKNGKEKTQRTFDDFEG